MTKLRVWIDGETGPDGMPAAFVVSMAEEILVSLPAVIVTDGFLRRNDRPDAVSTESAALEGARRAADRTSVDSRNLLQAWVPDQQLDVRSDVGGLVRMTGDDGVIVRITAGRTALGSTV